MNYMKYTVAKFYDLIQKNYSSWFNAAEQISFIGEAEKQTNYL